MRLSFIIQLILASLANPAVGLTYDSTASRFFTNHVSSSYADSLDDPIVGIIGIQGIDRLQVSQEYSIIVESVGCFHHSRLYLMISRKADGYYAEFRLRSKIEGQKFKRTYKSIRLNEQKIDSIRAFERQLVQFSAETYSCTTVDTYYLTVGATKAVYKTDNCDWQGIAKLVHVLFTKQEEQRTTAAWQKQG